MRIKSLRESWQLREEPLFVSAKDATLVQAKTTDWMEVESLPCDVHEPLIEYGRIEEPLVGGNSFDCEWIENRSWWFRKTFTLQKEDISRFGTELFIEMLDIHADLFLNGSFIGHHASAFYPFRKNVSSFLQEGENILLIRLTTGLEHVTDEQVNPIREFVSCEWRTRRKGRGEDRRVMLRKPQYVFGWDQSPRLGTCAIAGDVRLEILDEVVVRDIRFETLSLTKNSASILAEVEVESRELLLARECFVTMTVELDGEVVHTETKDYVSQTGSNFVDFSFSMEEPKLWWPNGYGEQPLYTVKVSVRNNMGAKDEKSIVTGVRTVKLDTSLIEENNRNYAFVVNGKHIYCRGTDFIPTDQLYARVTCEQQEKLLTAARDANFCMVRFWDGNLYQNDEVYDICDRLGILVLQNFCFACGAYPDHIESFCKEVENEAIYQVKRLRNRPSLAIWYGNGENASLLGDYFGRVFVDERDTTMYPGGTYIYNQLLPKIHHSLCKSVGYQCSTPFGKYIKKGDCNEGDVHYYPFLDLRPENQKNRISVSSFESLKCKFVTEGGVMGPPSAEKLIKYCGGRENVLTDSTVWEHHLNTFERNAVRDGIYQHYTGERPLTIEEYCLYGGLFQGNMLAFEADQIRLQPHCGGCVLWVLNDGFGEVGFSVMDHDGDPKPAYYFLKRAYAPNRLILRVKEDKIHIYCTNSRQEAREISIHYGYTTFDGNELQRQTVTCTLDAHAPATLVATMDTNCDVVNGVYFACSDSEDILSATLRSGDFSTLCLPRRAELTVSDVECVGNDIIFTVSSDVFAHAIHFCVSSENRFSDQYFDLLPGEKRRITWMNATGKTIDELKPECVYLPKN